MADIFFVIGVGNKGKLTKMLCDSGNVGGALHIGKFNGGSQLVCNRRWAAAADAVTNGRPAAQRPPCF